MSIILHWKSITRHWIVIFVNKTKTIFWNDHLHQLLAFIFYCYAMLFSNSNVSEILPRVDLGVETRKRIFLLVLAWLLSRYDICTLFLIEHLRQFTIIVCHYPDQCEGILNLRIRKTVKFISRFEKYFTMLQKLPYSIVRCVEA